MAVRSRAAVERSEIRRSRGEADAGPRRRARRSQFFIIAAVIIMLNLLAINAIINSGYRGGSERPTQEASLARDFNSTIIELYAHPYSFKRNVESLQLGIQKGSAFSSQIFLSCSGLPDCTQISVGSCTVAPCVTSLKIVGSSMEYSADYSAQMGR